MEEADLYFTQTIVGAPLTVLLGKPQRYPASQLGELVLDASSGRIQMHPGWSEWLHARSAGFAPTGTPWRRPGRLRRFVLRNALWLTLSGWLIAIVAALVAALALLAPWLPQWAPQWLQHAF